ncbi:hypothetical protein KGD83_17245 [Nocardiopsis akebiae]|uniref:Uncharacterized protein n=1 Tax=Nocardiopsis akebiae TaxID=2831968 RepID=A0ABX8BYN6_9ACTN|nr:hypothetical protein KGD83_17245 [Nocardiopsis akebiae]
MRATALNAAFAGLEADFLMTGDRERTEAALEDLCAWTDSRVAGARPGG